MPTARDSPRWCARCEAYGDHHTDRCPNAPSEDEVLALERLARAERERAERIRAVADQQTGAIRGEVSRRAKRKAAKQARRRAR